MIRLWIFRLLEPLLVELHDYLGAIGNRMEAPAVSTKHHERRRLYERDQHRRYMTRELRRQGGITGEGFTEGQTLDGPEEEIITINPPVWRSLYRRIRGIGRTGRISRSADPA